MAHSASSCHRLTAEDSLLSLHNDNRRRRTRRPASQLIPQACTGRPFTKSPLPVQGLCLSKHYESVSVNPQRVHGQVAKGVKIEPKWSTLRARLPSGRQDLNWLVKLDD